MSITLHPRPLRFLFCWLALAALLLRAQAAELQVLHGQTPKAAALSAPLGQVPGNTRLNLAIGLPLRNREALTNLLRELYTPASPQYRHFLTPKQFTERFGPTAADYRKVAAFARAHGLQVSGEHPNRVLLDVSGSAAHIEQAFHVKLRQYPHPNERRTFYAPDGEPSLDLGVPVLGISGLNDYALPRPRLHNSVLTGKEAFTPNAGSGPSGTYMGHDFRTAYVPDSTRTGAGQVVGLLQFDGYNSSDIAYYETKTGLPSVTLTNVLLDGFSGSPTGSGGEVEVCLDIEMAVSMAPGLSKIIVYMAGPYGNWHDILNRMATDNLAKQLSCSWYSPGAGADPVADQIFQQMAAQGQSFFNASGDYDAYTGLISFPGDTPYMTQVGGTTLTTSGTGGAWASETVWNWGNGIGSGGGVSTQYPIPPWQAGLNMTPSQGSTSLRNTPDVALTADNVYVRADGFDQNVGGTSCAAPLWAGFMALVNEQAVAAGKPTLGFINPALYALGQGGAYAAAFHDTTTGSNTRGGSPTKFYAVAGYDLCTGWGTPAGNALINALATPDPLQIVPLTGFSSYGRVGGPFSISSQIYTLTNIGSTALGWTLLNPAPWLSASASGGTLAPAGPATPVTLSLNPTASTLVPGSYNTTVWFTNVSDGVGQSLQFSLAVLTPPAITNPPVAQAVLGGATAVFNVGAAGSPPLSYHWQRNGTNLVDGANIAGAATMVLSVGAVSFADLGTYSVLISNLVGATSSAPVQLTMTPSPPVLARQPADQSVYAGRTAVFSVGVQGTPPFSYQWSFNGTNLNGASGSALLLPNVLYAQAGTYSVLVTNQYGPTNSAGAVLTVNPPPPCAPPPAGLVDWWPGEGDASDIAGSLNGTLYNGTSFASGEVGQAFSFDGLQDFVGTAMPGLSNIVNTYTMEFWAYPTASRANTSEATSGLNGTANQRYAIFPAYGGLGVVGAGVSVGTNGVSVFEHGYAYLSSLLVYNAPIVGWTHIAVVYVNQQPTLYVNGVAVHTGLVSTRSSCPSTFLGEAGANYGYYAGLLDEVSIYNRALTPNEVQNIYIAGNGGKCVASGPPVIFSQPTNQTSVAGSVAVLSVMAGGSSPLSYQWSFNGTNALKGANSSALMLTNVQYAQAGTYSVLVTNLFGFTNSADAVLTVIPPPPCAPPAPGLVDWWRGEGDAQDAIGSLNGTLYNGTGFGIGQVGQCFSFDGIQNYVGTSMPGLTNILNTYTMEFWAYPTATRASTAETTSGLSGTSGQRYAIFPNYGGLGTVGAGVSVGNNGVSVFEHGYGYLASLLVYDAPIVGWTHIAVIYVNQQPTLYVNGVLVHTGVVSTRASCPSTWLGEAGINYGYYSGLLDEVSIYNRALSAAEVQAIYTAGAGGKCFTPLPPSITTQPADQAVLLGGTANFSVKATGTAPLVYQWSQNGTNLAGASRSSLVLTNVQFSLAGTYRVLVTNSVGSAPSSNALLTVMAPQTNCTPPTAGLVDWWPGEGNANDIIGGFNGSLMNGTGFGSGEVGQAFSFDGVQNYVNNPVPGLTNILNSYTMEFWAYPTASRATTTETTGGIGGTSGQRYAIFPNYGPSGPVGAGVSVGTNGISVWEHGPGYLPSLLVYNTNIVGWAHIVVVYLNQQPSLYLNGLLVHTGLTSVYSSYPSTCLGEAGINYGYYAGLLDEVSIYNRALSAAEVQAIYTAGNAGKCSTPQRPVISSQPTNQTVVQGGAAAFSVLAAGTPPLSFQWRLNGTNLAGARASSLLLTNLQFSQAGSYSVMVTNTAGSTLSSNAVLTVLGAGTNCTPPALGLVDWWPGEGTANDIIGGLAGTLMNGTSFGPGEVGQAFSFDGVQNYINNPVPGLTNILNSYTMEFWAYPTASRATTTETTGGIGGTSGQRYAIFPNYGPSGPVGAGVSVGTNGISVWEHGPGYLPSLLVYNTSIVGWAHIAVVYVNRQPSLYLNGVLVHTGLTSASSSYPSTCLGEAGSNYGYYAGLLDEVSIYNRALSAPEVQAIYTAGTAGKCFTAQRPVISSQPTNQIVVQGGAAAFGVQAAGTPPPSYQWRLNGTNLAGASASTLLLTNVQFSQAGSYSVLVTNTAGSALSSNAVLSVLGAGTNCTPPAFGLVDWWPAEGNANDIAGALNGTLVNGTGFAAGKVGAAFSFDGTKNYVSNAVPGLTSILNTYTMEFWAYPTASRATTTETTSGIGGTSGQRYAIFPNYGGVGPAGSGVSVGTNGVSVFEHASSYLSSLLVYNGAITGWTHVAVVYLNQRPSLYLNGALARTGLTSTRSSYPSTCLGEAGLNYGYYAGLLDEVSIYNRALSAAEVQAIYLAGSAGKCVNHPPSASNLMAATPQNRPMSISTDKLLLFASDPDNDPLTVSGVSNTSTNGGPVQLGGGVVTYTPLTNYLGADRFTYTVSDSRGGAASGFILVNVWSASQPSGNMLPPVTVPGGYQVGFLGLPGYSYTLQRSANAAGPWLTLGSVKTDANGLGTYLDANPPAGQAFYRTTYP